MGDQDFQKQLASWARQTIAFGISLRAQDDGQAIDDVKQVQHAAKAMDRIVSELWEVTAKEYPETAHSTKNFTGRVLDWVQDQRHSKN